MFSLPGAGNVIHQFATDGPVKKLLFCDEQLCLITLTTKMVMTVHNTDCNVNLLETMKVSKRHFRCNSCVGSVYKDCGSHVIMYWPVTCVQSIDRGEEHSIVKLHYKRESKSLSVRSTHTLIARLMGRKPYSSVYSNDLKREYKVCFSAPRVELVAYEEVHVLLLNHTIQMNFIVSLSSYLLQTIFGFYKFGRNMFQL